MIIKRLSLLVILSLALVYPSLAQTNSNKVSGNTHEYYIAVKGIDSKAKCSFLINKLLEHKEVSFADANDFPVTYFKIISSGVLSKEKVSSWIFGFAVIAFGESDLGKEQVIIEFNKNNK